MKLNRFGAALLAAAVSMACGDNSPAPVTLASGLGTPVALASDATAVYWVEADGSVKKAAKSGGGATQLVPALFTLSGVPFVNGFSIAVDASRVFFTALVIENEGRKGVVGSVPLEGGAATTLAEYPGQAAWLALDDTSVYVARSTFGTPEDGVVEVLPKSGGTATQLAADRDYPRLPAVDGSNVYWFEDSGADHGYSLLTTVPKAGGTPTTLADGFASPLALKVFDGDLYWMDGGDCIAVSGTPNCFSKSDGVFGYLSPPGSAYPYALTLATGLREPKGFDVTQGMAYFIDVASLYRVGTKPFDPPELVAQCAQCNSPRAGLVLDETAVYWVDGGSLVSLAR